MKSNFKYCCFFSFILLLLHNAEVKGQCYVDSLNGGFYHFQNPGGAGNFNDYLCAGTDSVGTTGIKGYYDGDGFSVNLISGTQVTFSVDSCTGFPVSLTIVDDSNNIIPGAYSAPACPNSLNFTAPNTGKFSVVMNVNGNCGGGGTTLIGEVYVKITTGTNIPVCPGLYNDTICGSIPLYVDSAFVQGNSANAAPSDPLDPYLGTIGADSCSTLNNTLWYSFHPNNNIDTLNIWLTSAAGSGFHSWLVGFVANSVTNPCTGGLTFLGCVNGAADELGIDTVGITLYGVLAGHDYYFMIDGYSGGVGEFSLALKSYGFNTNVSELNSGDFIIYPNPAYDYINITDQNPQAEETNISLFNIFGEEVLNKKFNNLHSVKIDIGQIASGMYILKLTTRKGSFSKKIVVYTPR